MRRNWDFLYLCSFSLLASSFKCHTVMWQCQQCVWQCPLCTYLCAYYASAVEPLLIIFISNTLWKSWPYSCVRAFCSTALWLLCCYSFFSSFQNFAVLRPFWNGLQYLHFLNLFRDVRYSLDFSWRSYTLLFPVALSFHRLGVPPVLLPHPSFPGTCYIHGRATALCNFQKI